jgi:MOSC domain-containing protein YiiM
VSAVVAVSRSGRHRFSKQPQPEIRLLAGIGVEGDAHAGSTVQHRSRKRWRPADPNLRQVHLLQGELLEELRSQGHGVSVGDLGENILTRGIDLLGLPTGARLEIGPTAVVEVTGLRNPCVQMDRFSPGLMEAVLGRTPEGELIRKAGVMGIVINGGAVVPGDAVLVELPEGDHAALRPV